MPRKKEPFSQLSIPTASLTAEAEECYFVYKDPKEFVKVKAETALLAMEQSGIKHPYRVVHHINMANIVLKEDELLKKST